MRRFISIRTAFAVAAVAFVPAVAVAWTAGYPGMPDERDSVSGGASRAANAREADILAAGSAKAGFQLKGLQNPDYELVSADVSGPPNGFPDATAPSPFLTYRKYGSTPGTGEVLVTQAARREGPASFGRQDEPKPVAVASSVPGFEVVRAESKGAVALTGWTADRTYELVFYPPNPSDPEMLKMLESFVR